jgi:hypothetical protein
VEAVNRNLPILSIKNVRVLVLTMAVSIGAGLLFGLGPAWRTAR